MTSSEASTSTIYPATALATAAKSFDDLGFTVIEGIYQQAELNALLGMIAAADTNSPAFRKTADLFAIRQVLKQLPDAGALLLSEGLKAVLESLVGNGFFLVKSIYFDKPENSNWFVAWHQDLSISVDTRGDFPGFGPWTAKHNQYGVQPPLAILEDNVTIRIHLDDTTAGNGALRVLPGSHRAGICRPERIDRTRGHETVCEVPAGGIMLMRPLLLHASDRSTNSKPRRVVHLEFSRSSLPPGLNWSERIDFVC